MQFDFDSVRARLVADLQSKASWANVLFYSTNQRLLDVVAAGIAELAQYDEYLTRETKWSLARNRSSLITQSKALRYDPHRKVGATGTIRVSAVETFDAPPGVNLDFPKWTVFSNGGDIQVCTVSDENLTTGDNYLDLDVVQGTPKTFSIVATGDVYEEVEVENLSVENVYYDVYVNGELWTEVSDLRGSVSTDKVYELLNHVNFEGVVIRFGNNVFGKKLELGDSVVFRYVETLGAGGNVLSSDIMTTVESTIYDITGVATDVFCNNIDPIDGGANEEDIEDIRMNGPDIFQTGDRATSVSDYRVILSTHAFISKANVWGEFEYNEDLGNPPGTFIPLAENVVYIAAFTPGGAQLSEGQKDTIREYLADFKAPTDVPNFIDVDFINLKFNVTAYVSDRSYTLSQVRNSIITGLSETYDLDNMDFWTNIYESDFKAYVDGIEGVDHHTTIIEMYHEAVFDSAYEATINIPLYPVTPSTVEVYVKDTAGAGDWVLVGTDDGAGGFTAEMGYDLTGSAVNYANGESTIVVASGLAQPYEDYDIKVYFQIDNADLVLNARQQIFRYAESDVTTQYTEV